MIELFFILLSLIPYSINKYNIQQLPIIPYDSIKLDTTNTYSYFSVHIDSKVKNIYFYLLDDSYGLYKPTYCITTEEPIFDIIIDKCVFRNLITYKITSSGS